MNRSPLLALVLSIHTNASTVTEPATGFTLSVSPGGAYLIHVQDPAWTFAGTIGQRPDGVQVQAGMDRIGAFDEIVFRYQAEGGRKGAIRTYRQKPIVLFTSQFLDAQDNTNPFPSLHAYPRGLHQLTYNGWQYRFQPHATDGPLVEFDSASNTFILSPASHFMVSGTSIDPDQDIVSGVNPMIQHLAAGFTHQTLLVVERSINQAFETWGHALTDLQGKVRPANDSDLTLSHLGYWTDNGATYYYHYEPALGYEGTLLAIRDEFLRKGAPLGYLQLDSWFYPKGPHASWRDGQSGIYEYVASADLFPQGLKAFQEQLGIPLVTHARWIDAHSPYRQKYVMSGNVVIDPSYWKTIMSYLHDAGVVTYEQDWLAVHAHTDFNLTDPDAFLDNMAQAASSHGLTMQYCMPLGRHYLQTSKFSNLTTIRVSPDRFDRSRWDQFLYGTRLAGALGVWPWCDVFMSSEPDNLLLATLSAGPVGVGDRIGAVNAANLLRAVRKDGVIVKPDAPLVPLDESIINDAQESQSPMVAATYTDFGTMRAAYVFAYPRRFDLTVSFRPSSLGLDGTVYVYDYLAGAGQVVDSTQVFAKPIAGAYAYYVVTPVGISGLGLVGDTGQFVSLGKQRIPHVADNGVLEVTVSFAPGEGARTIRGYSPSPPVVTARRGVAANPTYDTRTQLFSVSVSGDADGSAIIDIAAGK